MSTIFMHALKALSTMQNVTTCQDFAKLDRSFNCRSRMKKQSDKSNTLSAAAPIHTQDD